MNQSGLSRLLASALPGLVLLLGATADLGAQTTLNVNSVTRTGNSTIGYTYSTWQPIRSSGPFSNQGYLMDPVYDQQTGQGDSDFVSATVSGQANPGFFIQFGQVNGVDSLGFRVMMNEFKTTGNIVNIRFGLDGDMDGAPDIFMGLSQQSNQTGLVFQAPGTGTNLSPSTTTLGNAFVPAASFYSGGVRPNTLPALNAGGNAIAIGATNFSNIRIDDGILTIGTGQNQSTPPDNRPTYYPGWVTQYEDAVVTNNSPLNQDSMISYAIPVADINAALASLGETWTVSGSKLMLWMAVTATQNNSVNQDAYGTNKTGFSSNYTSFLQYMDAFGNPIPEPASYGLFLGIGLGGFLALRRRPARRTPAA